MAVVYWGFCVVIDSVVAGFVVLCARVSRVAAGTAASCSTSSSTTRSPSNCNPPSLFPVSHQPPLLNQTHYPLSLSTNDITSIVDDMNNLMSLNASDPTSSRQSLTSTMKVLQTVPTHYCFPPLTPP